MEIYCLTVPEAGSLKSGWQDHAPSQPRSEMLACLFLNLVVCLQVLVFLGL